MCLKQKINKIPTIERIQILKTEINKKYIEPYLQKSEVSNNKKLNNVKKLLDVKNLSRINPTNLT